MNIKQMKSAISQFRKADLSMLKDENLRAKGQKLQAKQKGFTLLELLVVIALLATIATGALIAYENVGDNAQAAAGANSAATIDRAIRTFKAVEGVYPNQWDNLALDVANGTSGVPFLPEASLGFLGAWDTTGITSTLQIATALSNAGINEVQNVTSNDDLPAGLAPNRAFNESTYDNAREVEMIDDDDGDFGEVPHVFAVVPNKSCNEFDGYPLDTFNDAVFEDNELQNRYADLLEDEECHAVVALGFGGDAAASTALSNVAIAQSPTYARQGVVDPNTEYSRFIGLFLVGLGGDEDTPEQFEYLDSARLLAVIATDGENIDSLNAQAASGQSGGDDD